jgi:hypothetical protein
MNFTEIIAITTIGILTTLSVWSLIQISLVRKGMRVQSEHQIYARMIESRMKLENTEAFTKMAKESPLFAERLSLVDNPDEYYTIVSYLDLLAFLHHQHNSKLMDTKLWPRWRYLSETLM